MDDKAVLKDHRQIGQELDLFSFHDVSPGAVYWHAKGWLVYRAITDFVRSLLATRGYQEISTPILAKADLFKRSGHWEHYHENMFVLDVDKETYAQKPMNCPEACLIYATKTRSYHDLPIRLADFGILHRNELSGTLGGLFRVRQFSIDDAHHFVRPDQIQDEIHQLILLVVEFYKTFGFAPEFFLSTRPDKAMGDPKLWDEAEKALHQALKSANVTYGMKEKDGAFYGPKIDIQIKDSQNRDWQLATIQLDFQIPQRMELAYIDSDGASKQPVIIHRAIVGSLERFIGVLLEHYQGALPTWICPIQVTLIPIADRHVEHVKKLAEELRLKGVRVEVDSRNESMQSKIRDATLQKVPFMGIIGDKELASEDKLISVRARNGENLGQLSLTNFIQKVLEHIDTKV